jgi:diguanylate cyclase (GGDEF)-like protein
MTVFFSTQLDFILFFYGLAFILLGTTCFAIARIGIREEAWTVLGLFGFLHGGSEWLDLTALVVRDGVVFQLARLIVMTSSFVVLMEFARRESIRFGLKTPGLWIYIPLLALVGTSAAIDGPAAANDVARYIFGFGGAMATSLVFARLAQAFSGLTRRLAFCAAAGFAAYGLVAGVVVPVSSIWPASVVNQEWFVHMTGVPVQLVRGVLACWLAFSIWSIWGQQLTAEVSSARYTRFLRQQYGWTLAAMAVILVAGWMLTELLGGIYKQSIQRETGGEIDLLSSRLAGETAAIDGMVRALAGTPSIAPLLSGGSRDEDAIAQSVLDLDVDASGAVAGYILDRSGSVVAASGRSLSSRTDTAKLKSAAVFLKSIAGEAGSQFSFDPHNGEPDYLASYPVRARDGKIAGVAVLEKKLGAFAVDLRRFEDPYFLVDPDGIVAMTNRPDLLLQPLWPASAGRRGQSAQTYGELKERPMVQSEIADATWINFGGERDFVRRRYAAGGAWSLVMLKPIREVYASRFLGIVITLLTALMTLIYLFGRERWVHDNVQMERRLNLQELAQNLSFQATTDPLTGLFNRLKFDQALTAEMLRSERYETPLSLVMYDIDHFKKINDTHGHQTGDMVLRDLSKFVAGSIRATDMVARWGGEEFVIMLPSCNGDTAFQAAEGLRTAIEQIAFENARNISCSFGVTEFVSGDTAITLMSRADNALYRAKINGRNRAELAEPPDAAELRLASVA